jgi:peroxiredoxin
MMFLGLLVVAGSNLIGTIAPEWENDQWLNSKTLRLSELKGKVVLLRFFMESSCPMCRASAPYLNDFYSTYKDDGLIVIGMYTPKPTPRQTPIDTVRRFVEDYQFVFPVALDNDWKTLKRFWLESVPDANYTSVSFLIDKKGVIRYIHPGGSYSADEATKMKNLIETLLAE